MIEITDAVFVDAIKGVIAAFEEALNPDSKVPKDALRSSLEEGKALVEILESEDDQCP